MMMDRAKRTTALLLALAMVFVLCDWAPMGLAVKEAVAELSFPSALQKIMDRAFKDNQNVAGLVEIPDHVTYVGEEAFDGTNLHGVAIEGDSVQIGNSAFNADSLAYVRIDGDDVTLGEDAIAGAKYVFAPSSNTEAKTYADSQAGTTFVPLDKLATDSTFYYEIENNEATVLVPIDPKTTGTSVTIPGTIGGATVTGVGDNGFLGLSEVKTVNVPVWFEVSDSAKENLAQNAQIVEKEQETDASFFKYKVNADQTATITGATAALPANVVIPEMLDGHTVTGIAAKAFYSKKITSVHFPSTIREIGNESFAYCQSLMEVQFSEGLQKIGDEAFTRCSSLGELNLPDSLEVIGERAFYQTIFHQLVIPPHVRSIGTEAFGDSSSVYIPKGVTGFDEEIMYADFGFMTYEPRWNTILFTEQGSEAAQYAKAHGITCLEFIMGAKEATLVGCNFWVGNNTSDNYNDTYCAIPKEVAGIPVTAISDNAFKGSVVAGIWLPNTIRTIGASAFEDSKLAQLQIEEPCLVSTICEDAFKNTLLYQNDIDRLYNSTARVEGDWAYDGYGLDEGWRDYTTILKYMGSDPVVEIPREINGIPVTGIALDTFKNNTTIEKVTIPGNIEKVTGFDGCSQLKEVVIEEGVKLIYHGAFRNCIRLETIHIPSSVEMIGNDGKGGGPLGTAYGTFYNCVRLKRIQLPSGLTALKQAATFNQCRVLEEITIPEGIIEIQEETFEDCSALKQVSLPETLQIIGDSAFNSCRSLEKIYIPESVTSIGTYAFYLCPITIQGIAGSYAETYAKENKIPFEAVEKPGTITFTMSPNPAVVGSEVTFEIKAPGAEKVQFVVDEIGYEEVPLTNGMATFVRTIHIAGDDNQRIVTFRAYMNGEWIEAEEQTLKMTPISVQGKVTTADGTPITGASVSVMDEYGNAADTSLTDEAGGWSADGLALKQTYSVVIAHDSFLFDSIQITPSAASEQAPDIIGRAIGDNYLMTNKSLLRFDATEGQSVFTVTSTASWTLTADKDWMLIDQRQGESGMTEVRVSAGNNPNYARSGLITLTAEDGNTEATVGVVQVGEASRRLQTPVITYPSADGEEVPFGDLAVTWNEVTDAYAYVISMRDLDTDELFLNHQAVQGSLTATLSANYFADDHTYRIALGAVPAGVPSTDETVSWCERVIRVLPAEEEAAFFSGYVYAESEEETGDLQGRGADIQVGDDQLITTIGTPVVGVEVHVSHYDATTEKEIADGVLVTDDAGRYTTNVLKGQSHPLVVDQTALYTFSYVDPYDKYTFRVQYKNMSVTGGENRLPAVYGTRYNEEWQGADPYAEMISARPHGLWAEYFEYTSKPKYDADQWGPENKRNEGYVSSIDFNWKNETVKNENRWKISKEYYMLKPYAFDDAKHKGAEGTTVNYVPQKFSARFNGYIQLNAGADGSSSGYKFRVRGDDGVAIFIKPDQYTTWSGTTGWKNGSNNTSVVQLGDGEWFEKGYVVHVDIVYYNKGGDAKLILEYSNDVDRRDDASEWKPVPADWLYAGSRTIWITGSTGIQALYRANLDSINKSLQDFPKQTVKGFIEDFLKTAVGAVIPDSLKNIHISEFLLGDPATGYANQYIGKFAEAIEDEMFGKVTKSIYGAVAGELAGTNDDKTLWQAICSNLAKKFSVNVSDITPESTLKDGFKAYTVYYNTRNFLEHRKDTDADSERLYEIFANLNFSDIDHISAADRLYPQASMASLLYKDSLNKQNEVDKNSVLKEAKKAHGDVSDVLDLVDKGKDMINDASKHGNTARATLSLLLAENGQAWYNDLNNASLKEASRGRDDTVWWFDYMGNSLSSVNKLETQMNGVDDKVIVSLLAALQGVDYNEILYKELLLATMNVTLNYYKGVLKQ